MCKANGTDEPSSSSSSSQSESVRASGQIGTLKSKREADSTDGVSTFLTRRFGIAGGLAWVGVLATGVLGEQIKTRLEQADEAAGTKVRNALQRMVNTTLKIAHSHPLMPVM